MRRRTWLLVLIALVVASCAPRGSLDLTADEREEVLTRSAHAPRQFTFERTTGDDPYRIVGEVEDDYRYRATLSLDGREVYEEFDIDDLRIVQVRDPGALPERARSDATLAPLLSGAWVRDAANAPNEFAKADSPARLLDPKVVLEKVRYLEQLEQDRSRLARVLGSARHDPGSTRYIRKNDKFPPYREDGVRYDVLPGAYDANQLFGNGIPTERQLAEALEGSSMYASYWFKAGRVTRIELFFDIDVEAVTNDLRAAGERQAKQAGVPVSALTLPTIPRPYRETYTFGYPAEPIRLAMPTPTATVALPPLAELLGAPS